MPSSKTKVEIAARSAALRSIPKELLDRFVTGPMSGTAVNAASMAALGDAGLAQPASSRCGAVRHPGSTPPLRRGGDQVSALHDASLSGWCSHQASGAHVTCRLASAKPQAPHRFSAYPPLDSRDGSMDRSPRASST
jgi:hypothetical protein